MKVNVAVPYLGRQQTLIKVRRAHPSLSFDENALLGTVRCVVEINQ